MKNNNNIFHELKEISPLIVQIENSNVYSVSPSYFNNLPSEILKKIELNKEIKPAESIRMPFSVPVGYFEGLSADIFKKIQLKQGNTNEVFSETALIAPVLNTINKKEVYIVPDNFFEKRIISYVEAAKQTTKVVHISRSSKFFRLSVAAAVTSLLAVGLYIVTEKNFRNLFADDTAKIEVRNLSKEEIVDFLKTNSPLENITSALPSANEIKSSLKKISDKEIQQFLKETGESDDI